MIHVIMNQSETYRNRLFSKSMALFSRNQFTNLVEAKTGGYYYSLMSEARAASQSKSVATIFLSHSHSDKELVKRAIAFFRKMSIEIYVDWMDVTMPEKPNGVTASNIKSKILNNDKFVFLATDASIMSKWCNWEIGIGDAYKLSADKICILPLTDERGNWLGSEYLQIYPRVESVVKDGNLIYDNIFKLIYPNGQAKWLDDWLKQK